MLNSPPSWAPARVSAGLACVSLAVPLAACDLAGRTTSPASVSAVSCAATVSATLEGVARGVYRQAVRGRAVAASRKRLANSPALAAAVARR